MTNSRVQPEDLMDLDRLNDEERAFWDEHFSGPLGNEGALVRIWSFGYACMLWLDGPPTEVVSECLSEHDPENLVLQYLENVRRAR